MEPTNFGKIAMGLNDRKVTRRSVLLQGSAAVAAGALAVAGLSSAARGQETTPEAGATAAQLDLTGVAPQTLTGARLAEFEAHIATTLAELEVPGASVAVVQGGEVVFLQAFGVRELDRSAPVTADTLLRIGSVTKSFSSLLAATLVDDGRLSWETPLVDLLPDFAVADPDLTPLLTVADSFGAASGLPRRDWEIVFNAQTLTPELIVAEMARLPLTAPYGAIYQYSNQMVAAGGWAAAMADGGSSSDLTLAYDTALRAKVLQPIDMRDSTLSLADAMATSDFAAPHAADLTGSPCAMPLLADDTWVVSVAPSGGLWSSAREMARYVQTLLGRGLSPDGGRVVSAENLERTWKPGVSMGAPAQHYGLGWVISEYNGQRMIFHAGATLGYHSLVSLLPDADLGLVVLTNASVGMSAPLTRSVAFRLFELLFEQPATFDDQQAASLVAAGEERAELEAQLGQIDPVVVTPLLGRYASPDLGEATLTLLDGKLEYAAGGLRSGLRPSVGMDGSATAYLFLDAPLAFVPPELTVIFDPDAASGARLVLKISGEPGGADLVYPFEHVGAA